METKAKIIGTLERLQHFFEKHNVSAWVKRSKKAIQQIQLGDDSKSVLNDLVGAGMGSLIDLYICADNGHSLTEGEDETNKQLGTLATEILTIKQAL
jgi:hypothetical protein